MILTWTSILEDDSVFGDASLSRLEFRWWRPKIAKDQLYRDKTWIVQPDMVPSVAILRQVPPGECNHPPFVAMLIILSLRLL